MTRIRRVAATAAFVIGSGTLVGATSAHADEFSVIWVDNASGAGCADAAGSGSQATPYCTIQAAVNVAQPGSTVRVEPGVYNAQNTISTSGTVSAPITIQADSGDAPVMIGGGVTHAFDVSGASNIVISGFDIGKTTDESVLISDSSDITIQKFVINNIFNGAEAFADDQIHVTGASSHIDISQNVIAMSSTTAVQIDAGGSDDTVTTNVIGDVEGDGIVVDSTTGTNIVSNTIDDTCGRSIALTGTATGATIENNILEQTFGGNITLTCGTPGPDFAGLVVEATATAGTVENYNDVVTAEGAVEDYNWAGTPYATAADFHTATGQGGADYSDKSVLGQFEPSPSYVGSEPSEKSAAIDSANSDAPGELATDVYGDARVDDPLVADTGVGTYANYDRGAVQRQDTVSFVNNDYPQVSAYQAPVGTSITVSGGTVSSAWGGTITKTVDFGDGSAPVAVANGTAGHTYTAVGSYNLDWTAQSSYGATNGFGTTVNIDDTPVAPQFTATSTGALSVSVDPSKSTDPWETYLFEVDFGDGYSTGSEDQDSTAITHTYAEPGTYTITLTMTDAGGTSQTSTSYRTAGSDFTAYGPSRILDTRKGIGAAKATVTRGQSIKVKVAGVGAIPANITAVAINLTATDTVGNGYVTASTGSGSPSNLNFSAGQTVANNAILPVDANGYITLGVNGTTSSTAADVIGDVTGYFTLAKADGYSPVTLSRLLDTRKGVGAAAAMVAANSGVPVTIAGADSIPAGVSAVAVHVTVVDTTGNGWIAAEPDGAGTPTTSILNYLSGQTVSNTVIVPVAANGKVELYNGGGSTSVDLLADVAGYFSSSAPDAYYPVTPYRAWDTRAKGSVLAGNDTQTYALAPTSDYYFKIPAGASLAANLTVVDETANGFITAYPTGTTLPAVSNLNYLKGQTVAGLSLLPTTGSTQNVAVYNNSAGTTDLIMDVFGYFAG